MKILSIGNSFSQDAQRYLYDVARRDGVELKTVNLYIGGCTLRTHYLNMLDDSAAYKLEFNGRSTGVNVSMRQVLISDDWDVITLQQASHLSARPESYSPYLEALAEYARRYCPHAKLFIHETWFYEDGSERLASLGYATSEEMLADVREAYGRAARIINADGIIPSGDAMMEAYRAGLQVHRDSFHASHGAGRYLLALTWYKALLGRDITGNSFDEFDSPVTEGERRIVIDAVNSAVV